MVQIGFNFENHHFYGEVPEDLDKPLTLTLQVTRKCNLHCIYCSEEKQLAEPNKEDLGDIISKIKNVGRIIISGGEPLLRPDIIDILKEIRSQRNILALATNCTRVDKELANKLVGLIDYADITIDGPRNIHNVIRGNYDSILEGIFNLREKGIEYSFVTV
jgi:MoaA/NifB/PqqE/SkfB family radical SAM enzyme